MRMLKRIVLLTAVLATSQSIFAAPPEREQVPDQYKWDLTQLYANDDAWRAAKEAFAKKIPSASQFKGTLAQSPAQLLKALDTLSDLNKELSRLYVYAALLSDQDTRVAKYQAMKAGNAPEAASINPGEVEKRLAEAQGQEAEIRKEVAQRQSNASDLYNRWQQADAKARTVARPSTTTLTVPPPTGEPTTH